MNLKLLADTRLYDLLLKFDQDIAAEARAAGCGACGGQLHEASYPRKPRGAAVALPEGYARRWSFCCAEEGCRRRTTPPSVRFLGRRVYLGAVVVLASAMQHGVNATRGRRLEKLLGISQRTLTRWRQWWLSLFTQSALWKAERARFMPPVDEASLPLSILDRLGGTEQERLWGILNFVSPLATQAPCHALAL